MKFAGIIAEYDPFHNGHAWQLAQAKALGAQHVAVAMSCGLTQRGALPLLPEAVRVQAALQCGADLIFALPAPCACAGAEAFARAGVRILAAAGCDALVFGAETPDAALLMEAARVLCSAAYRTELKRQLAAGARSFAAARQAAVEALCPGTALAALLDKPNNNLAVEYCKAILEQEAPCWLWMNPADAEERGIKDGDTVRVFNDRGEIRKQVKVTDRIVPGVVSMPTGSAHDADMYGDQIDYGGCVNTLSPVKATPLTKGTGAHSIVGQVEKVGE